MKSICENGLKQASLIKNSIFSIPKTFTTNIDFKYA